MNRIKEFLPSKHILIWGILFVFLLLGCSESSSYAKRLQKFYSLLDAGTVTAFEKGEIPAVAEYLKQKQSDPDFKKKYQELKADEAIDLFNDQQTAEFFYKYFFKKKS